MVLDNHAECKNAVIGLVDALTKIRKFAHDSGDAETRLRAIATLAEDAISRHQPILQRI